MSKVSKKTISIAALGVVVVAIVVVGLAIIRLKKGPYKLVVGDMVRTKVIAAADDTNICVSTGDTLILEGFYESQVDSVYSIVTWSTITNPKTSSVGYCGAGKSITWKREDTTFNTREYLGFTNTAPNAPCMANIGASVRTDSLELV